MEKRQNVGTKSAFTPTLKEKERFAKKGTQFLIYS